jgi:hypothetical protein
VYIFAIELSQNYVTLFGEVYLAEQKTSFIINMINSNDIIYHNHPNKIHGDILEESIHLLLERDLPAG